MYLLANGKLITRDSALPYLSDGGVVIDGLHRFWAYQQMGYQTVTVYQNKPWAMPTAA